MHAEMLTTKVFIRTLACKRGNAYKHPHLPYSCVFRYFRLTKWADKHLWQEGRSQLPCKGHTPRLLVIVNHARIDSLIPYPKTRLKQFQPHQIHLRS
jgi:hypothetical protein